MNLKRTLTAATLLAGVGLALVACGDSSWEVPNLATTNVDTFTCQQTVQALNTLDKVLTEKDPENLTALGVNDQNKDTIRTTLNARNNTACNSKPSGSAAAPHGTTDVVDTEGNRVSVPFVSGETISNGDTRESASMPSLSKLLPDCGVFVDWQSLVDCVNKHHAQWYIDGVNQRAALTGFNWDDVVKWGSARLANGDKPEVRVIQVYSMDMNNAQARQAVTGLVGADVANSPAVKVKSYDTAFMNTWRTQGKKPTMTTFADYNHEVRVTLAPLVLNGDGTVKGLLDNVPSGVFVDCYNVHGFFPMVPTTPASPLLCPPGSSKAGQPMTGKLQECSPPGTTVVVPPPPSCKGCTPPPPIHVCPPDMPHGTWPVCKDDPSRDPVQQGHAGNGGGKNTDPGPGTYVPPAQMTQPPATSHVNPPPPKATATPPPVIVVPTQTAPQPTVAPSTQPPNNGTVPTTGCGDFC